MKTIQFLKLYACAWLAAVMLIACAQVGVPAPTTFNQKALAAHNTVAAAARAATTLRTAGKLSDTDRGNVVATLTAAEGGIDLAEQMVKTDPSGASAKLDATITVLTAMQAYLATHQGK